MTTTPFYSSTGTPETARRRRRRGILLLAAPIALSTLLLVLAVLGWTTSRSVLTPTEALLSDGLSIGSNSTAVGSIELSGPTTTAGFDIPAMMPGDEASLSIPLTNSGRAPLRYRIRLQSVSGDVELLAALELSARVSGDSGTEIGSPLHGLVSGGWLLGNSSEHALAVGESDDLTLTLSLPLSAGNETQDTAGTFSIQVLAEQTANNAFISAS